MADLGLTDHRDGIDLHTEETLPPSAVLGVVTEDKAFVNMARGYPEHYPTELATKGPPSFRAREAVCCG
ncbi:hypothetical protein EV132_111190 [Rhizobium sullae]|uniref:Uncharacterized protein n=1 Tax=Rhizobium sullae TaxID=50338 RepID=A0A4R3Q0L0_RHISU|nr:hypothetical protein EV132_111190 [Rhizobium sullae]